MLVYWIWLAQLKKLSCEQKWQLLQHFSDPEEIYHCDEEKSQTLLGQQAFALEDKDLTQAKGILRECEDKGIRILTVLDKGYPSRLRNTCDPPILLYFKGTLPDWERLPAIGIVGTRNASIYGLNTAAAFGRQIAACGAIVVSGAADGVDAMAMQGALDAGKGVVGVLGCGVDIVYPKKNLPLYERTGKTGCLISEYPPRTPANAWHFPQRNRIISGICNGILVVEAPEKSGALITARHAWEQGRDVFAVPGNVDSAYCAGSNALLRERAIPALSGWDVVREYAPLYEGRVFRVECSAEPMQVAQKPAIPKEKGADNFEADKKSIDKDEKSTYSVVNKPKPALTNQEQAVLAHIGKQPQLMDELLLKTDLNAGTVKAILTRLAIKGVIKNHPGGRVSRK